MQSAADMIQEAILSRQAVGIALILAVAGLLFANRGFIGDVAADPARSWRVLAHTTGLVLAVTLVWVTLLDDWLLIATEPYRLSLRWEYQRLLLSPIDSQVRTISLGLLALTVVLMALLTARHLGGYLMQFGLLLVALISWIPLFILNQRLNALIVQGAIADASLTEVLGLAAFWVVRLILGMATVAATAAVATMLMALVATVMLDLFRARDPRTTHEADDFFGVLGEKAVEREDVPMESRWRPIAPPP